MLKLASDIIEANDEIEAQAGDFVKAGIKPMDALHLASWKKTDYFCTCDDRLLKNASKLKELAIVSPLQLVTEVTP